MHIFVLWYHIATIFMLLDLQKPSHMTQELKYTALVCQYERWDPSTLPVLAPSAPKF